MSCYEQAARIALDEQRAFRAEQEANFRARAMRLIQEGLTDVAAAKRLGCGPNRVRYLRVAAGITPAERWGLGL